MFLIDTLKKLNEEFINGKHYVYHLTKPEGLKGIFKFGFESFYGGKNVGMMYGRGVYSTTDLESTLNNMHGSYGNYIIKAEVFSFDKFLIYDMEIAKQVYGNHFSISDQLNYILPPEMIDALKDRHYSAYDSEDRDFAGTLYDYVIKMDGRSAKYAMAFYSQSKNININGKTPNDYVEGLIFSGQSDGNVAVIRDFKNLMPVEYSTDRGNNWIVGYSDDTVKHTKQDFDVEYRFGKNYSKVELPSNGYAKVINDEGKINYIDREGNEISDIWFNAGGRFKDYGNEFYLATVDYNGKMMFLAYTGDIYLNPEDDYPLCHSSELPDYV